ncbi:MAG: hypothetical protein LLF89_04950 [Spirochaetaceae bacterium]|nr:hypothetical protein [Spirochaetaceae bacterium]
MKTQKKNGGRPLGLIPGLLLSLALLPGCATTEGASLATKTDDFGGFAMSSIVWQKSGETGDRIVIPGTISSAADMTDFRMEIDKAGGIRFFSMEPSGSGELPLRTVPVRPVILEDGRAVLMKDFPPLLNSAQPLIAKQIAVVSAKELFAPAKIVGLPAVSPLIRDLRHISWKAEYEKDGALCMEGKLSGESATVSSGAWSLSAVLRRKFPGAATTLLGDFGGIEAALVPFIDDKTGTALLLVEKQAEITGRKISYLYYCAKVPSKELMEGFQK